MARTPSWLGRNRRGRSRSSSLISQEGGSPSPEQHTHSLPAPLSPPSYTPRNACPPMDRGFAMSALQRKLQALEEVRSLLGSAGVEDVPGIVVIGSQNSGKSSLLESISGISFPRSEGMCTSCPTIVSLEATSSGDPFVMLATDAGYTQNKKVLPFVTPTDRLSVQAEIHRLMQLSTKDGAVTKSPIYVRVIRRSGVTMTMCDLPGITAISSSQPDVEEATVGLTSQWAANKRMILLCCVAATDDFHNSQAIKIALKEDPGGSRTIGVVTKCDTLPAQGDLVAKLKMERSGDVKLHTHGFIAVRNRTQEESERGSTDEELWEAENSLFTSHPQLSKLPEGSWGIQTLVRKLQSLQARQLDQSMPPLFTEVRAQLAATEGMMDRMPPALETMEQRRWRLLEIVQACSIQFHELVTATDTNEANELHLAARSHDMCCSFIKRVSERLPDFLSDECLQSLSVQVGETRGVYLPNLLHGSVFRRVMKQTAELPFRESAVRFVEDLASTVMAALTSLLQSIALDQTLLCERLVALCCAIVDEERQAALVLVHEKVDAEFCCPFTLNQDYETSLARFEQLVSSAPSGKALSQAQSEGLFFPSEFIFAAASDIHDRAKSGGAERGMTRRLQASLHAYQHVLKARLFDSIPIDVRHRVMFRLHSRLAPTLLRDEAILLPLLAQDKPEIAMQRSAARSRYSALRASLGILQKALSNDPSVLTTGPSSNELLARDNLSNVPPQVQVESPMYERLKNVVTPRSSLKNVESPERRASDGQSGVRLSGYF